MTTDERLARFLERAKKNGHVSTVEDYKEVWGILLHELKPFYTTKDQTLAYAVVQEIRRLKAIAKKNDEMGIITAKDETEYRKLVD